MKRSVFFVSDRTGITVEALGRSLLTQFENITFEYFTLPFVDSKEKAEKAVAKINKDSEINGERAIVFASVVEPDIQQQLEEANGVILNFFNAFITPLENELNVQSNINIGKRHGIEDNQGYNHRIDALNFAMSCDDGVGIQNYEHAELIIVGVSRSGKTPTSLYLALHFGIYVANYPMTEEDLGQFKLPDFLKEHQHKLFGLTIDPQRLRSIRQERRPNSRYASIEQCREEISRVEKIFKQENIRYLNTTTRSVEEIATKILNKMRLERHYY